jgi:Zn-dependent protease with chaperone function
MKHASNATAHLFIANPFGSNRKKKKGFLNALFLTHPPTEQRIAALRDM